MMDAISMGNKKIGALVTDLVHGGYMIEIDLKLN